jgi:DNA-binding beta-propeller fold protein YncE
MKRSLFSLIVVSAALLLPAVACNDIHPIDPVTEITYTYGGYFLNAGFRGEDDAEITQLNTLQAIVNPRIFATANNGKTFGDDARDIHIFGNKMYVTLAGNKMIRVMSKFDCTDQGTVTVQSEEDGSTLTPLFLTSFEEALIVSFKEGYVALIDTVSFLPRILQKVGTSAGQVAIANQKLYVASSDDEVAAGGFLLMLNPVDLHIMKTIDVAPNPTRMVTDPAGGDLYVISAGDDATEGILQCINSDTDEVTVVRDVSNPTLLDAGPDHALVIYTEDASEPTGGKFLVYHTETQRVEGEFIRDGTYVSEPCLIAIDRNAGNVYIAQSPGKSFGTMYIFTSYGQFLTSFNTGAPNPCGAVFVTGN